MIKETINSLKEDLINITESKLGISKAEAQSLAEVIGGNLFESLKKQALLGKLTQAMDLVLGKSEINQENVIVKGLNDEVFAALKNKIAISDDKNKEFSLYCVMYSLSKIAEDFKKSGEPANVDGFANFTGIDKNIIKSLSGGLGSLLGKMF